MQWIKTEGHNLLASSNVTQQVQPWVDQRLRFLGAAWNPSLSMSKWHNIHSLMRASETQGSLVLSNITPVWLNSWRKNSTSVWATTLMITRSCWSSGKPMWATSTENRELPLSRGRPPLSTNSPTLIWISDSVYQIITLWWRDLPVLMPLVVSSSAQPSLLQDHFIQHQRGVRSHQLPAKIITVGLLAKIQTKIFKKRNAATNGSLRVCTKSSGSVPSSTSFSRSPTTLFGRRTPTRWSSSRVRTKDTQKSS